LVIFAKNIISVHTKHLLKKELLHHITRNLTVRNSVISPQHVFMCIVRLWHAETTVTRKRGGRDTFIWRLCHLLSLYNIYGRWKHMCTEQRWKHRMPKYYGGEKKVSIRPPQIPREMQWDRNFSPFNILHEYVVCFPYIETEFQNIL
jgi:hypothetical protein